MKINALLCATLISAAAISATPTQAQGLRQGLLQTYTCLEPNSNIFARSSFINIPGQRLIRSVTFADGNPKTDEAAGAVWVNLNTPFNSLSFDVKGPACSNNNEVFFLNVVLTGTDLNGIDVPDSLEFFECENFSGKQNLGNGFTRYTIDKSAFSLNGLHPPQIIKRIVFIQYTPVAAGSFINTVFGNPKLNGTIVPNISTVPADCPGVVNGGN